MTPMNTTNISFPSNRVADIERHFHQQLSGIYSDGEIRQFVYMLFEDLVGWDNTRFLLNRQEHVNQSDLLRLHWALEDLKRQRPIQYIIGHVDFCGCKIGVGEGVLIPRPETEEIVCRIMTMMQVNPPRRIVDLCTGSGCMAVALAKHWPEAEVVAVDLSPEALRFASRNAEANGVSISVVQADVMAWEDVAACGADEGLASLIVSNPPYVCDSERALMRRNVLDYEPAMALFVSDDDPLRFYRAIANFAKTHLSDGGLLAVEINERFGAETISLFRNSGFRPSLYQDFNSRDRFVVASR